MSPIRGDDCREILIHSLTSDRVVDGRLTFVSAGISRFTDEYISLRFRSSSSLSKTSAKPQSKQTRSFGNARTRLVGLAFAGGSILICVVNALTFSDRQERQAI